LEVNDGDQPLVIISDGFPELLFSLENKLILRYPNGHSKTSGEFTFLSQLSRTAELDAQEGFKGIFVKIYPWVSRIFCPIPQDQIVDSIVDQGEIPNALKWIRSIDTQGLHDNPKMLDKIQVSLEDFVFSKLLNNQIQIPPALTMMVKNILTHRGMTSIDQASQGVNSSRRYIERIFGSHLGLPPDFYNQLIRTKEITRVISSGEFNTFSELSSNFDFYDSAHFCNQFRKKIGMSPSQFKKYMDNFPIYEKESYLKQFIHDELAVY